MEVTTIMDHQKIESRMKEIQTEHSKILDEIQKLNKQVQDLTARKIYLEGAFYELRAFYELENMLKEDSDEPADDVPVNAEE